MKTTDSRKRLVSLGLAVVFSAQATAFEWKTGSPEEAGFSAVKLEQMRAELERKNTKGLLITHHDRMVLEWYGPGMAKNKGHYTASMAKALVGGMGMAILLTDDRIKLDAQVSEWVPEWKSDPAKARITFRQLGSHTSGMEDAEEGRIPHNQLTGWKGDFWKRLPPPSDPFTISRDKSPLIAAPGEKFQYSNPGIAMLGYGLTAVIANTEQKNLRVLLRERVMRAIGVPDGEWSIGYGQTVAINGLDLVAPWGGGNFTARASARVGLLMLQKGTWEGREVLNADAVDAVTRDAGTPGTCGIGWWSNNDGFTAALPHDAFWAAGAEHQVLLVVPSWNVIAVRNGGSLRSGAEYDSALRKDFFESLSACRLDAQKLQSESGIPPSPVIAVMEWDPVGQIIRKAKGSDNWPMTWCDDDHLYTAYGDGNGFDPRVPEKLSLGLARVEGVPPGFSGVNLRVPGIEQKGDGKQGRKASGMLMVNGRLFMWLRNATNAQLAWSDDRGVNWKWSGWRFEKSFGCPTFLNFGKNYAGARDDYVYVYSHDANSAYEAADRFVLARVPSRKIMEQSAYEFLERIDGIEPKWTRDLDKRGAVFSAPGRCYRSNMTYNTGLKRFLWCQTFPGEDARFGGGFGIYDAPEPWGPWTKVFETSEWDTGPGESSSFPTKWMSADGKTLWLVFSGEDCFSVRRAKLKLR